MGSDPTAKIDRRFSDPEADPTPWSDVVVEGSAVRVIDRDTLQRLADAYEAKYGSEWHFEVGDGVFGKGEDAAAVFRIEAAKVLAFAKDPHAQTTYRFTDR